MFADLLRDLEPWPGLHARTLAVLSSLPAEVQQDFLNDPRFQITIDNYTPETGWTLWMPAPGPPGEGSRCVVLRKRLEWCHAGFAAWVIAHEFAHAWLRNGPWGEITDVEEAADAMAAVWGYLRPPGKWADFFSIPS
ncbi:MAG TPA: hypothetical protein DCR20_12735 [Planctomycetaceae bacterium]|jgi:hypothetical protein|nr:hypothetical protein [Planctomycetaceae bacterium]